MLSMFDAVTPVSAWCDVPSGLEFVGYSTATGTGASISLPTTGLTGGTGSSVAVGDLLIVASGWSGTADGNPGVTDATFTWTEVADLYANDTYDSNLSVAWANATTTPPANVTVSGPNAAANSGGGILMVFRNHNSTTPMDATATTATGTNTGAANPPSITSVTTGATIVAIGANAHDADSGRGFTAAPSGYTLKGNIDSSVGTGNDCGIAFAILENQVPAAYDPGTFTVTANTSDSWTAVTLAVRPG